ncbi:MAG TPA: hypothetical protein VJ853_05390, partial [Thermoanaerobaculia bacterium]|nr:hypothetical protein [Thermoanaerobaculia bacterium]
QTLTRAVYPNIKDGRPTQEQVVALRVGLTAIVEQLPAARQQLERAYREHAFGLIFLGVAPEYDGLRADPRFRDLMRRVGVIEPPNVADSSKSSTAAAMIPSSKSTTSKSAAR